MMRNVTKSMAGLIQAGRMAGVMGAVGVLAAPAMGQDGNAELIKKISTKTIAVVVIDEAIPADDFEWTPVNGQAGTTLSLMIDTAAAGVSIVGIDGMDSTLKTMKDSTGRDLTADPPNKAEDSWASSGIGSFPKMSKDSTKAVIEITGQRSPAAGAKSMTLDATLAVQVAKGQKKVKTEHVDLKAGPMKAGDRQFKINKAEIEDGFEGKELALTLELTGKDSTRFAGAVFYDAAGKVIESNRSMSMQFGETLQVGFTLKPETTKQAVIELAFWDGFEVLQLPVQMEVPVAGF